jgi:hypothetical protein
MSTQAYDQSRRHEHTCSVRLSIIRSADAAGLYYKRRYHLSDEKVALKSIMSSSDAALMCLGLVLPIIPYPSVPVVFVRGKHKGRLATTSMIKLALFGRPR